jgi:hypothetical protein
LIILGFLLEDLQPCPKLRVEIGTKEVQKVLECSSCACHLKITL